MFTGKHKTLNRGKAVATALALTEGDAEYVHKNPMFELYSPEYIHNIRVLSALDNLVAINNALAVDLSGQITAEALGPLTFSGAGGLLEFAIQRDYVEVEKGYFSKCHLCLDIRKHLVEIDDFAELSPQEFYKQIDNN